MPGVPYINPFVQYAGFQFDYNAAFLSCCSEYAVGTSSIASVVSSFNTASVSSLTVSSINGLLPGTGAPAISSFNTASISSATISSLNGWSPDSQLSSFYTLSSVVGGNTDPLTTGGTLWSYSRYAESVADTNLGTLNTLLQPNGVGAVGTISDAPSLTTSLWAHSKQTELDAQKSSMSWDFEGSGLGHSTTLILAPPYQWTTAFQHIWTMTATIPSGWQGRGNTFISLFIWNTFATNTNTFNYFDYSINGGSNYPLGRTSAARAFTNGGLNQLVPITGNLVGISLAPGDVVAIRFFGRVASGTHTMTSTTSNDTAWGVFTASF